MHHRCLSSKSNTAEMEASQSQLDHLEDVKKEQERTNFILSNLIDVINHKSPTLEQMIQTDLTWDEIENNQQKADKWDIHVSKSNF